MQVPGKVYWRNFSSFRPCSFSSISGQPKSKRLKMRLRKNQKQPYKASCHAITVGYYKPSLFYCQREKAKWFHLFFLFAFVKLRPFWRLFSFCPSCLSCHRSRSGQWKPILIFYQIFDVLFHYIKYLIFCFYGVKYLMFLQEGSIKLYRIVSNCIKWFYYYIFTQK